MRHGRMDSWARPVGTVRWWGIRACTGGRPPAAAGKVPVGSVGHNVHTIVTFHSQFSVNQIIIYTVCLDWATEITYGEAYQGE